MSVRSSSNKQQPEQSLLLEQHQHHHQHHRIFFFTAAISGLLGALASVFAKLASNTSPATGGIIYSALCHALAQPLDVDTTNSHNTISDPCNTGHPVNALKLYYQIATLLRLTFVACTVMANAAMWKIFTHALTQAAASVHVTIITSAANMLTTGICGLVIFNEPVTLQWWCGAVLILIGSILMGQDSGLDGNQPVKTHHQKKD